MKPSGRASSSRQVRLLQPQLDPRQKELIILSFGIVEKAIAGELSILLRPQLAQAVWLMVSFHPVLPGTHSQRYQSLAAKSWTCSKARCRLRKGSPGAGGLDGATHAERAGEDLLQRILEILRLEDGSAETLSAKSDLAGVRAARDGRWESQRLAFSVWHMRPPNDHLIRFEYF